MAFDLCEQLVSLILYRMEPLSYLDNSTLDSVDLMLGGAFLLGALHSFHN
jgi:hypothetical protein